MKVILTESVEKLGQEGEVKEVANGYARNFLFPRGLAIAATTGALKQAEARRTHAQRQIARVVSDAEQLAARLNGLEVLLFGRSGEQNRLYGSITAADVADAIKAQHKVTIDRRKLTLDNPIHRTGNYTATANLGRNITAKVAVTVESEANRAAVLEARRQAAAAAAAPPAVAVADEGPTTPLEAVASTAGAVAQTVAEAAGTAVQTVAEAAGTAVQTVAEAAAPVAQTVAEAAGTAAHTVADVASGLVRKVTGGEAPAAETADEAPGAMPVGEASTADAEISSAAAAPAAELPVEMPVETPSAAALLDDAGSPNPDAEIAGATAGALESGTLTSIEPESPADAAQEPAKQ